MAHLTNFEGVHQLYYLGFLDMDSLEQSIINQHSENAIIIGHSSPPVVRSVEERIIEKIEHAQLIGKMKRRPDKKDMPKVAVHVSKTGIKLIDVLTHRVIQRIALHKIMQAISYDDGFNELEALASFNVVLLVKTSTLANKGMEQCHLLQSYNPADADHLCKQIRQAFASVQADVVPPKRIEQ